MFETISRIYSATKNKTLVKNAVLRNWITELDFEKITGDKYE